MTKYKQALEHAVNSENWYAAMTLSLTLPDICGAIDKPGKYNSRERYSEWFDRFLGGEYSMTKPDGSRNYFMTGGDCYALRCAFLHEGSADVSKKRAENIVKDTFILHHSKVVALHKIRQGGKLLIDMKVFCFDIISGVTKWEQEVYSESDQRRRTAISSLLSLHLPDVQTGGLIFAKVSNPFL
jgi:hypothetical protein